MNLLSSIVIKNQKDEIKRVFEWLMSVCEGTDWSAKFCLKINLVLEEWVVNVISHAFTDNNPHDIKIDISLDVDNVILSVTDDGIPFDPLKFVEVDILSSMEEREAGGLGIYFIKNRVDSLEYERKDGMNIVTFIKKVV
jgi:anti-sigma regulatory factor (Ser/Thr protein kinase)